MIRALSLAILASCAAVPASAQTEPWCVGLTDALAALRSDYGETVRVSGMIDQKNMMLVTVSEGGTWTILIVTADGKACFATAGTAFSITPAGDPA